MNDVQTVKLLHFLNASSVLQWVSIFCLSINLLLLLFSWLPCCASCALNSDRLLEASSRCERVLMLMRRISLSPNMWAAFKDLLSLAEKKHTQRTLKYRRLNLLLQNKDDEIGLSHFVSFFYSFFFFCLLTGTLGCASLNLKSQTSLKVIIITFFLILLEVTVVGVELTTATLNNETSPSALCRHQRWVLLAYGRRRQLRALRLGSCAARPGATMPRPNIFFFPTRPRRRGRVGGCVPGRCPLTRTGKFILWDD